MVEKKGMSNVNCLYEYEIAMQFGMTNEISFYAMEWN